MPAGPLTRPLEISAFSRSRDKVGTAAASARSSRQPAASSAIVASMMLSPRIIGQPMWGEASGYQDTPRLALTPSPRRRLGPMPNPHAHRRRRLGMDASLRWHDGFGPNAG